MEPLVTKHAGMSHLSPSERRHLFDTFATLTRDYRSPFSQLDGSFAGLLVFIDRST